MKVIIVGYEGVMRWSGMKTWIVGWSGMKAGIVRWSGM